MIIARPECRLWDVGKIKVEELRSFARACFSTPFPTVRRTIFNINNCCALCTRPDQTTENSSSFSFIRLSCSRTGSLNYTDDDTGLASRCRQLCQSRKTVKWTLIKNASNSCNRQRYCCQSNRPLCDLHHRGASVIVLHAESLSGRESESHLTSIDVLLLSL